MLDRTLTPFVGHDTGVSFPPNVDRYRIDRALGSGAFASVWLGHDDALESPVAIKVLSGSLVDDLDVRNRFLEEARILRRADSERLVRVHDIGELPDRRPYFVMSYADRGTLADRMRERPLPVNEAVALAEEIAYGVEVINALGVIHRDLKPSNVLFQSTPDGGEKLLIADLGLAKALAHASGAFTLPVGTPGYMSPEQARFGGGLDVRADVYGLGALTFHMLAGRAPGPAPVKSPPSELREGVTAAMDQVVLRALEVDRENRWPTAEAFAEALSTLIPPSARIAASRSSAPASPASAAPAAPVTMFDEAPPSVPAASEPAAPAEPRIDPDATVLDFRGDGTPAPSSSAPSSPSSAGAVPPGMRTRFDPPPAADGDQTIVDHPGPRPGDGGAFGAGPSQPSSGGLADGATVAIPSQHPSSAPNTDDQRTAAFPAGQPPGPVPPPGGHGPPPTGFQPPPPVQGQGQGGSGGAGGGPLGRLKGAGGRYGTPLVITAVVLAVAVVAGLLLGTLFSGDGGGSGDDGEKKNAIPKDFVQLSNNGGKIKVAVPKAWPLQQEQTWAPSIVGLNDPQERPVLRATTSVDGFQGNGAVPGVFIGVTTDMREGRLPPPTAARHPQCKQAGPENYTSPDKALTGTITRFTGCASGTASVTEVGLRHESGKFGLWIRVKETDDRKATTDILDHLQVTGP
ncbi:serine/threonine-protein kinase [Actinomadura sp. WAC 06369]|uniref:serine/threonine-protein kinase n=1 Tax=Actinomadura sp. WAC 06369 TaxID=2203193 RepID=UPI000F7A4F4D|nr:serine/threonine-protein kinase [Actinomadura sp. WAC 06369]RSN51851.1 serine/threonine protein kinase [Actinomadura sp. WAC 06369]